MSLSTGNNETLPASDGALSRVFSVNVEGKPQTSEWLHPAGFDYEGYGNNAAVKRASDDAKWASDNLAAIDNLRATPHPEDTPARHARKVRERLMDFENAWIDKRDGTAAALKAEVKRVDADLEQKAGLKPNPAHFDAVTAAFHGMKPAQRARTLGELIDQGESAALATLVEAPLFLTGLTAEQRDSIRVRVFTKVDPAGLKLRDYLAKVINRWDAASKAATKSNIELFEGTDRFNSKVKAAEAVAKGTGFAA